MKSLLLCVVLLAGMLGLFRGLYFLDKRFWYGFRWTIASLLLLVLAALAIGGCGEPKPHVRESKYYVFLVNGVDYPVKTWITVRTCADDLGDEQQMVSGDGPGWTLIYSKLLDQECTDGEPQP